MVLDRPAFHVRSLHMSGTLAGVPRRFHPSRLRRWLAGSPGPSPLPPPDGTFRAQARRFTVAQTLVRAFYAFLLYLAVSQFTELAGLLERNVNAPLWPIAWLRWVDPATGLRVLLAFYLGTNIFGAFTAPWRASRVLTFLGLLQYVALKNSFGKIGHSLHLPLIVAGIFVLLPSGWNRPAPQTRRCSRQETLLVFWLAQAAVLLSYSMSGAAKVAAAAWQLGTGQPNAFAPGGLGAFVAQRLLQTHSTSFFGAWIIHHPFLTWPALPAAISLEFFAFLVAFRPALARPWAALLILFHGGTYYTMTITFPQNCFLLVLFFFVSPFEPEVVLPWQARLLDVPCLRNLNKFRQTTRQRRGV